MKLIDILFYIFCAFMIFLPFILVISLDVRDKHIESTMPYFTKNGWMEYYGGDNYDRNFTYMPHEVMFHIIPEREGIGVVAWASDSLPPTTGHTDNKSEVTIPLLSYVEYNIIVDQNRCSFYLYPQASEYTLRCP